MVPSPSSQSFSPFAHGLMSETPGSHEPTDEQAAEALQDLNDFMSGGVDREGVGPHGELTMPAAQL